MTEEFEQRMVRNEALFREANEAIRRGLWPGETRGPIRFRCECSMADCQEVVEIPLEEYKSARESDRRFILLPGHEVPEAEQVVEREDDYVVVEKNGRAGEAAEELS
jgi:hypothetical protein